MEYHPISKISADKRPSDVALTLRHTPSLGRFNNRCRSEKKNRCVRTFVKSNKKVPGLQQLLKNVALLTEYSQYTGGTHYLPSGVILRKLLKWGFVDTNIGLVWGKEGGKTDRTERIEKREKEES